MLLNELSQYRTWRKGVSHATLNPGGPGAVRIHLVPPKYRLFSNAPHIVILNGYYIIPVGYSWAILIDCFLQEVSKFEGKPIEDFNTYSIVRNASKKAQKTYLGTALSVLETDLKKILTVFLDVAAGYEPDVEIGQMSLKEYAPNMNAPHRMDLMMSPITGVNTDYEQQCITQSAASGQENAACLELTTIEWKEIINRCKNAGIPQLTFAGGEPTKRADLPELIEHAKWFITRLNTNGVNLTEELVRKLKKASLDSVQITIYSRDPKTHNKLAGSGDFERTVLGIKTALAGGLDVTVNTPLSTKNANYVDTLAFLHELGVRYVSCFGIIQEGATHTSNAIDRDRLYALLDDAMQFCGQNGLELFFTSPGCIDADKLTEMGLTPPICGACLSNMAIVPDGTVIPCQSWLGADSSLGNMLRDDWKNIWDHPLSIKIRSMEETETLTYPISIKEKEKNEKI